MHVQWSRAAICYSRGKAEAGRADGTSPAVAGTGGSGGSAAARAGGDEAKVEVVGPSDSFSGRRRGRALFPRE
jgi:hypothetical protein